MHKPIAIITGASTGIGRSLAVRFSSKYLVYLISRNEKNLIKTKELIETNNGECKIIIADISKSDSINKIYSQLENKDKIDLLINNAGIGIFKNINVLSQSDGKNPLLSSCYF